LYYRSIGDLQQRIHRFATLSIYPLFVVQKVFQDTQRVLTGHMHIDRLRAKIASKRAFFRCGKDVDTTWILTDGGQL
jgi:hypothetical protein